MASRKNVFVTGSTGFIGRHLVQRLIREDKYNIICLLRNPARISMFKYSPVSIVFGDISLPGILRQARYFPIDFIFHCAALVENKNLDDLREVNVSGTQNVCEFALSAGVEKLVYLSSVAVVSGNNRVPLVENLPYSATNRYGESKIEAEKTILNFREKGLPVVVLRPPMVYGYDEPHMLELLLFLLKYRLLPVFGGGEKKFHLVYVENLVEAMLYSLGQDDFLRGTYFIADREVLTVNEVFTILSRAVGGKPPIHIPRVFERVILNLPYIGKRLNFFTKDREYSISKLKSTGFSPPYNAYNSLAEIRLHTKRPNLSSTSSSTS